LKGEEKEDRARMPPLLQKRASAPAAAARDVRGARASSSSSSSSSASSSSWALPESPEYRKWLLSRFGPDGHHEGRLKASAKASEASEASEASDAAEASEASEASEAAADAALFVQQRFCRNFLALDGPNRGLILYHGLGSGKSCSAIAASEGIRAAAAAASSASSASVFVLLPASLKSNYVREVRRCGGRMFREEQTWLRLPQAAAAGEEAVRAWRDAVGAAAIRDHGGALWLPAVVASGMGAKGGKAFAELTAEAQEQVRGQVDAAVLSTYRFVHYNGLNDRAVAQLCAGGPRGNVFDDSVVVIDEVHNFVSNLNEGKLVARLYQRLLEARRCKLLLLSGTPIVNAPVELAHLVNLAAGPIVVHTLPLGPQGLRKADEPRVATEPRVRDFWVSPPPDPVLHVRLLPDGFVRAGPVVARSPASDAASDAAALRRVAEGAAPEAARATWTTESFELLPSDADAFRAMYVDDASNALKNVEQLESRCAGCISYFAGHDQALYPTMRSVTVVKLPLSNHQYTEYMTLRSVERRKEDGARRFAAMRAQQGQGSSGSDSVVGLRPMSRLACTFVFPDAIKRPRPGGSRGPGGPADAGDAGDEDASDVSEVSEVSDVSDASEVSDAYGVSNKAKAKGKANPVRTQQQAYITALDKAIDDLRRLSPPPGAAWKLGDPVVGQGVLHVGSELAELSPKFDAICARLLSLASAPLRRSASPTSPTPAGTALVYSQFRRAEGVSLLAAAVEANGFVQLEVVRRAQTQTQTQTQPDEVEARGKKSASVLEAVLMLRGRPLAPEEARRYAHRPRYIMYSNDDAEAAQVLRALFNNLPHEVPASVERSLAAIGLARLSNLRGELATAMFITRSGAEGISTRNVREVHVVEPFWHTNRITQVIGRARRAHSHDDLPPCERTVDVRIYLATFTEAQRREHAKDHGGLTSDEFVYDVAQRKRVLTEQILALMRRCAVDAAIFGGAHPPRRGEERRR
jgi:hypothetical protein